MARFSKLILTIATYSFIIALVSLIIGPLNKEESPVKNIHRYRIIWNDHYYLHLIISSAHCVYYFHNKTYQPFGQ
jgi:hypothetical protein